MRQDISLARLSLDELEQMLEGRRRTLKKLQKQRAKWQKRLDRVDAEIAAMSGRRSSLRGGGKRPRNPVNLPDAIAGVLASSRQPLFVSEITDRVQKAGYRSSSANFRGIVNLTLIKDKRFENTARGVYRMRSGATPTRRQRRPKERKPDMASTSAASTDATSN